MRYLIGLFLQCVNLEIIISTYFLEFVNALGEPGNEDSYDDDDDDYLAY